MTNKPMTNNRNKCGIVKEVKGSKIKSIDYKTGKEKEFTFVKETIHTDDDGNIIGVSKQWQ
jgi:hypothetical protein|tara:strand:+ start:79 stop:261 length:183 start_codon:yes stop_codon:yes gene_type:complete